MLETSCIAWARPLRAARLLGIVAGIVAAARALPAQVEGESPRTAAQVTPYVWLSSFSGTIQPAPNAPRIEARRSFGELFEDVDLAFFVSALARRGRFVLVGDASHATTSRSGQVPTGSPAAPVVPAEGKLRQTSVTLVGGYRALESRGATLDVLAGARGWWLRAEVAAPALGAAAASDVDFVDPIVALRGHFPLARRWRVLVYGDLGGFGAGSEVTAQLLATANLRVARRAWVSGGYRALAVERAEAGVDVGAGLHGPLLGATLTF